MNIRAKQILAKYRHIENREQLVEQFGEFTVDRLDYTVYEVVRVYGFYEIIGTDAVLDVAEWLNGITGVEIDKIVKFLDVCYDCDVSWR